LDRIIRREEIDCEWSWIPAYLHAPIGGADDARAELEDEARVAADLGFDARFVDAVPFAGTPGVEYGGQAEFHPRKYLAALARLIDGGGSHIFEHTESEEIKEDPLSVCAGGHTVTCGFVVIATHTPLMVK